MPEVLTETDPNEVLRGFVTSEDGASDWPYKDTARWLYRMSEIIGFTFYSPMYEEDGALPPILIAIGPMNVNTYAGYYLRRNELGLRYTIQFNSLHISRNRWSLAETLTHEMGHVYQEEIRKDGAKPPYHNKTFVDLMEEMGIHSKIGEGYHWKPADLDGQFGRLMDKLCIAPPPPPPPDLEPPKGKGGVRPWWEGYDKPKGSSSLKLYTASECTQDPICKIRVGRAVSVACLECKGVFHPS